MRNNTETRLARSRQAAADLAAVIEPADIRADFPAAQEWHDALMNTLEQLAAREVFLDWTLVVLVGSSGTGKSSLLNCLTGKRTTPVGNIRPTTTEIRGFTKDPEGARDFGDYLGIPLVSPVPDTTEPHLPDNLVVVEAPDRRLLTDDCPDLVGTVENLLDAADLIVWVTEPQKYADVDFLQDLQRWADSHSSLVVLTHTDMLATDALEEVKTDLQRIITTRGLELRLLTTSIYQDASLSEFRQTVQMASAPPESDYRAMQTKLRKIAKRINSEAQLGREIDSPAARLETEFCDAITQACGKANVEQQLHHDYLSGSRPLVVPAPVTWLAGLKPNHQKTSFTPHLAGVLEVQKAAKSYAQQTAPGFPRIWQSFLMRRAGRHSETLVSALNLATTSWDVPRVKRQLWWRLWWLLQWLCNVLAVIGFVWLLIWLVCLLGGVTLPGAIGPVPLAPLAFIVGILLAVLCAVGGMKLSAARARKHGETGAAKFHQLTDEVSRKAFLEPMQQDLLLYMQLREFVEQMGGI